MGQRKTIRPGGSRKTEARGRIIQAAKRGYPRRRGPSEEHGARWTSWLPGPPGGYGECDNQEVKDERGWYLRAKIPQSTISMDWVIIRILHGLTPFLSQESVPGRIE
jgi:hypothetical protein